MGDCNRGNIKDYNIFNLWLNFVIAISLFILPMILSAYVSVIYYPLISLFLTIFGYGYLKNQRKSAGLYIKCMLPIFSISRALLLYTIVVSVLNFLYIDFHSISFDLLYNTKDLHINYFPVLLIAPFATIFTLVIKKYSYRYCIFCVTCNGFPSDNSVAGQIQPGEVSNILKQLITIGGILSIASWGYFIWLYNSASITDFDLLIFSGVPAIVALIHIITISIRYATISIFRKDLFNSLNINVNESLIRYIVIDSDKILLSKNDSGLYDTPFILSYNFINNITLTEAHERFLNQFHIDINNIKAIYHTEDKINKFSTYRFFCFISHPDIVDNQPNYQYIDSNLFEKLYNEGLLTSALKKEVFRIYTTNMSYKIFDKDGNYRFKNKDYRPYISLSDIKDNLSINYSDMRWLKYYTKIDGGFLNRIKKYFHKYIEGITD